MLSLDLLSLDSRAVTLWVHERQLVGSLEKDSAGSNSTESLQFSDLLAFMSVMCSEVDAWTLSDQICRVA